MDSAKINSSVTTVERKIVERRVNVKLPEVELYCDAYIDGEPIRSFKSQSLVSNFLALLLHGFSANSISRYDTSHTSRTIYFGISGGFTATAPAAPGAGYSSYGILVGDGSAPVAMEDYALANKTTTLTYGACAIYAPNEDAGTVTLVISRGFSNGTAGNISVNEIGLAVPAYSALTQYYLIARDVVSPAITVGAGKTLTLNYRLKTTLTGTGGFVRQFLDVLYRGFAHTSFSVRDITYSSVADTFKGTGLRATGPGGLAKGGASGDLSSYPEAQYIGIQIGTSTTPVAATDYCLGARIAHGSGSGQMLYYGSFLDNVCFNSPVGSSSFEIYRMFENKSGGSITVNETGIYTGYDTYCYCIARDVLGTSVTVNNDEVLKVVYKFEISL